MPRWLVALVVLLGFGLLAPTLAGGFYADDYVHSFGVTADAEPSPLRPWNLYDFGEAKDWQFLGDGQSNLPWWTDADWSIRFFRPLTSVSRWLDYAVWGTWAPGHHLTSLALFALLLVAAHRLYLALGLSPGTALLGLLILALSDASAAPVGWLANRNSLLEALFAVGSLLVVVRRREAPGTGTIAAALALALGAALAKESGALAFAIVAIAVLARPASTSAAAGRARWQAGIACALLVTYVAVLAAAGYGTHSLFYATPWREPLRFLANLSVLGTAGLLSLAGPMPIDIVVLGFPSWQLLLAGASALVALPLAVWVMRTVRGQPGTVVLAAWTAIFLVSQGVVLPSDRLLFVASVGSSGLLARFFATLHARRRELARGPRVLARMVLLTATLGSGLSLLIQMKVSPALASHVREKVMAIDLGPPVTGIRTVIVLQTDSGLQGFTLLGTWFGVGRDPNVRFCMVQMGGRPLRWTRPTADVCEIESRGTSFATSLFERVYLAREWTPDPERRHVIGPVRVEPVEFAPDGPQRLRLSLPCSADDPSLVFLRPVDGVLTRIAPPPVGSSIDIAAAAPSLPYAP